MTEDISPIQKQNLEYRFWELSNGGKIQYVKYPIDYNLEAVRTLVRRAMEMGFYEESIFLFPTVTTAAIPSWIWMFARLRQQQSDENRQDERVPQLFPCKRGYTLK